MASQGAPIPPPPPPPPMPQKNKVATPPPPMPQKNKVATPPPVLYPPITPFQLPPLMPFLAKKELPPPPPMLQKNKFSTPPPQQPPPPPPVLQQPLVLNRIIGPNERTSKLKRSTNMNNLYRTLKGKVESASSNVNITDVLAELTRGSAFLMQVEAEVEMYAKQIRELSIAINSFQITGVPELLTFHKHVESQLENLTDESQVLARFQDFPEMKLGALRMAAASYLKLDAILATLTSWKFEASLDQSLDKAAVYLNECFEQIEELLDPTFTANILRIMMIGDVHLEFCILLGKINESMVDLSSGFMELALKKAREAKKGPVTEDRLLRLGADKNIVSGDLLWKAFRLAFRVYVFVGGQDDRADKLTLQVAQEIATVFSVSNVNNSDPTTTSYWLHHSLPPPTLQENNVATPPQPSVMVKEGSVLLPPKRAPYLAPLLQQKEKLKRSEHMSHLHRALKQQVEASSSASRVTLADVMDEIIKKYPHIVQLEDFPNPKQITELKSTITSDDSSLSMASSIPLKTRMSTHLTEIEEDVQTYEKQINELKSAITTFETKDMSELLKFDKLVESQLGNLTDESQVLRQFEGFPETKLDTLREAAALYLKLEAMLATLTNWKFEAPVDQSLDKVNAYFDKIMGELYAVEGTKGEDAKRFQSRNIDFDFHILVKIKESMVDVSSGCMELALKEWQEVRTEAISEQTKQPKWGLARTGPRDSLWKTFQLAYRAYMFAGGQDDRADKLAQELAQEIETSFNF